MGAEGCWEAGEGEWVGKGRLEGQGVCREAGEGRGVLQEWEGLRGKEETQGRR